jgi:hypothetical protein
MKEQDDSKRRAAIKFPDGFRSIKRPTNGPIPDVVQNSDGHMYIVREFKEEMRGKKILDNMVVRAENGRSFTENEVKNFVMKAHHVVQCMVFAHIASGVARCICCVKNAEIKTRSI